MLRSDRVSILVPFLIISIGLGVLAWRSYELSARLEDGVNILAMRYGGYAGAITARCIDSAVCYGIFQASEQWQQAGRISATPTPAAIDEWLKSIDRMSSAIDVTDSDPT